VLTLAEDCVARGTKKAVSRRLDHWGGAGNALEGETANPFFFRREVPYEGG